MRDMSWRPVKKPVRRGRRRIKRIFLLLLILSNVAVVWYHGDPRDKANALTLDKAAQSEDLGQPQVQEVAPVQTLQMAPVKPAPSTVVDMLVDQPAADTSDVQESTETKQAFVFGQDLPEFSGEPTPIIFDPTLGFRTPGRVQRTDKVALKSGESMALALVRANVPQDAAASVIESMTDLLDFRNLRPGNEFTLRFDGQDELVSVETKRDALVRVRADKDDAGAWSAQQIELQVETVLTLVTGTIESSFWVAMRDAGEEPTLITGFVDVFAWEIDFYREVYPNDTFAILVDKQYAEGKFLQYGEIHAAEFVSDGHPYRAFRFEHDSGKVAYYDEDGQSLRKQLLKSPLKYGRVTSGFGRRRHPVLGYTRAHNGVDYGVPRGTPVWSVGDGRVARAGWVGGFGNLVEVRHANGWLSQYAHLSKINVKPGQRVFQKDIVGLVGSTGLSTAPHLHYGLKRFGHYKNPKSQNFERGKPLEEEHLVRFKSQVAIWLTELRQVQVASESPDLVGSQG